MTSSFSDSPERRDSFDLLNPSLSTVPRLAQDRRRILSAIAERFDELGRTEFFDRDVFLTRRRLEEQARQLLDRLGYSRSFVGWTMVGLGNAFWKDDVRRVPYSRRVLLLPHCMRNAEKCPARYDAEGLKCLGCGNCELFSLQKRAKELGYQVLVAEGTPIVLRWILSGKADAILGVGCLKSLEQAFEKLIWAGIPSLAVPLFEGTCSNTQTDLSAVYEMIETPFQSQCDVPGVRSWLPLLRAAARLFQPDELNRFLAPFCLSRSPSRSSRPSFPNESEFSAGTPNVSSDETSDSPTDKTSRPLSTETKNSETKFDSKTEEPEFISPVEQISRDFLSLGGKFYRPFITIAAFDVLRNGLTDVEFDVAATASRIPDCVKQTAVAMELFHKASLVHDDVEDDDPFRYGRETLHRKWGVPIALNVGDHLLGWGYQLLASLDGVDSETIVDLLAKTSRSHTLLCNGQGLELDWTRNGSNVLDVSKRRLTSTAAIRIYALKTSPAFDASLYAGIRLAVSRSESNEWNSLVSRFSRYLGVGFQIRNDLNDWTVRSNNKRVVGEDFWRGRPTLLEAFANESLNEENLRRLDELVSEARVLESDARLEKDFDSTREETFADKRRKLLENVRDLYRRADVFERADQLIRLYAERAEKTIETLPDRSFRLFLQNLLETILR